MLFSSERSHVVPGAKHSMLDSHPDALADLILTGERWPPNAASLYAGCCRCFRFFGLQRTAKAIRLARRMRLVSGTVLQVGASDPRYWSPTREAGILQEAHVQSAFDATARSPTKLRGRIVFARLHRKPRRHSVPLGDSEHRFSSVVHRGATQFTTFVKVEATPTVNG